MEFIYKIIKMFVPEDALVNPILNKENHSYFEVEYLLDSFKIPEGSEALKNFLLLRDVLKSTEDSLHIDFNTKRKKGQNRDYNLLMKFSDNDTTVENIVIELINKLENFKKIPECKFTFTFKITKLDITNKGCMRIYSLELFSDYLEELTLSNFIVDVGQYLEDTAHIIFFIDKTYEEFYTHNIFFIHDFINKDRIYTKIDKDISKYVKFYNKNCFFKNDLLNVTPQTYNLIRKSPIESINHLFNKLVDYLSLIYLSEDSSLREENTILCSVKGYTVIKIEKDFSKDKLVNTSLYEIFDWVYSQDKIEVCFSIATNIISLEYRENIDNINENVLESIKSNYIIYSIDNVERYIDIKSNIISSMSELGTTYSNSINNLIGKLKNTLGINITFFITIIIFNLIENKRNNLFTFDILIISILIIIGSFLYMLISTETAMIDLYKFHNNVLNIKESYNSLLAEEDINRTICKFYKRDIFDQAKDEILYYCSLGIGLLGFIVLGIIILSPEIREFILGQRNIIIVLSIIILIAVMLTLIFLSIKCIRKFIINKYEYSEDEKINYSFMFIDNSK